MNIHDKQPTVVERRTRRLTLSLPPSTVHMMDEYLARKYRRDYVPMSRTDLVVLAVRKYVGEESCK